MPAAFKTHAKISSLRAWQMSVHDIWIFFYIIFHCSKRPTLYTAKTKGEWDSIVLRKYIMTHEIQGQKTV